MQSDDGSHSAGVVDFASDLDFEHVSHYEGAFGACFALVTPFGCVPYSEDASVPWVVAAELHSEAATTDL